VTQYPFNLRIEPAGFPVVWGGEVQTMMTGHVQGEVKWHPVARARGKRGKIGGPDSGG
jgi:hypothetical protein